MIAKCEGETLLIFEKRTGMTAVFSGHELELLLGYAKTGDISPFIERLFDLGILLRHDEHRAKLLSAVLNPVSATLSALHIELTSRCPLSCPQCYKGEAHAEDLPLETFTRLIAEAEALKIFQIALGGGEPLACPHIIQALEAVAATEMSVTVTTSGYGLDRICLEKLIEAGANHIQVSLNAADRHVNALSRDGYDCAMNALSLLAASGVSFGINWVARKDNLAFLEGVVTLAGRLGADNVNVLRYKHSPAEPYGDVALGADETRRLADFIAGVRGVGMKVDSAYSQLLCYLHGERIDRAQCGCGAGRSFIAVTSSGGFKPCSHLEQALRSETIAAYMKSDELRRFIDIGSSLAGECGTCVYRTFCGGCRAVCGMLDGSLAAGERECIAYRAIS